MGMLPLMPLRLGSWWDKGEEIDIVADDGSGNYLFGECKWHENLVGPGVLRELRRKADLVARKETVKTRCYALFSRSGFTEEVRSEAGSESVLLLQEEDFTRLRS